MKLKNLLFVVFSAMIIIAIYFFLPDPEGGEATTTVVPTMKEALDIVVEMNKFLLSIAFIIIGIQGGAIIGKVKLRLRLSIHLEILFFLSTVTAVMSIFAGYYLYEMLVVHLTNELPDLKAGPITYLRNMQFMLMLASVFFFAWYLFNYYLFSGTFKTPEDEKLFDSFDND
ncbi:MAG: hypothetical protein WCF67_08980 [Chitinophagaceae bacterium]